jgi:hypothetical protein
MDEQTGPSFTHRIDNSAWFGMIFAVVMFVIVALDFAVGYSTCQHAYRT